MGLKQKIKKAVQGGIKLFKQKNVVPVYKVTENSKLLENKVALVSGGSRGIGYGIAKSLIDCGCKVIISGTNENKLKDSCAKLGESCKYILLNVLDVNSMYSKIEKASKLFEGNNKIDILVNSAGVHGNQHFIDVSEETYDSVLDVNLKGSFFMTQNMAKFMIKNKIKGHILNVSSSSALKPAWTPLEISKWGVRGFTQGASSALIKHGIVVNAIAPGPVATEMLGRSEGDTLYLEDNPTKRFATTEEIGQLAAYMVSDLCNLVIGDTFYISGGSGVITK